MGKHDDSVFYAEAAAEMETPEAADAGLMAKAMANAEGDAAKGRALYVQYRVEQMKERERQPVRRTRTNDVTATPSRFFQNPFVRGVGAVMLSCVLAGLWGVLTEIAVYATGAGRVAQMCSFAWVVLWPWALLLGKRPHRLLSWIPVGWVASLAFVVEMMRLVMRGDPALAGFSALATATTVMAVWLWAVGLLKLTRNKTVKTARSVEPSQDSNGVA